MSKKECYYSVLKINKEASENEIKKSYYKLAREFHPDKNLNCDATQREYNEERFKLIAEAYEVLSNEQTRATYDKFGHEGFSDYEFADAYDTMENFVMGGEIFEKYIGSNEMEDMEGVDADNVHDALKANMEKNAQKLAQNWKKIFQDMKENKSDSVKNLIKDCEKICMIPANRPILKYLGYHLQNFAGRKASDRSFMEKVKSYGYSISNTYKVTSHISGIITRGLFMYFSFSNEIKELQELEKLPEEEQIVKKEEIMPKFMEKIKKNESRIIEITRSVFIIMVHNKISDALEKIWDSEADVLKKYEYIDIMVVIGSIFMNYYDAASFKGIDLETDGFLDDYLKKFTRLYYELPKSNKELIKKQCLKYNLANFSLIANTWSFIYKEKYTIWVVFKKTKVEWYNYGSEIKNNKVFYKNINYVQEYKNERKIEIGYDSTQKRALIFEKVQDVEEILAWLKENSKAEFKTKKEYEDELKKKQDISNNIKKDKNNINDNIVIYGN